MGIKNHFTSVSCAVSMDSVQMVQTEIVNKNQNFGNQPGNFYSAKNSHKTQLQSMFLSDGFSGGLTRGGVIRRHFYSLFNNKEWLL